MHKIISDLPPNRFETRTRKAVTFETEKSPTFHIRRVTRYADNNDLKGGLLKGGSLPLSQSDLNAFYDKKPIVSDSLLDWPLIRPILKFSIARHQNLYILTAIDEKNTDSYYMKTKDWEHVRVALRSLTHGAVDLPGPAILEFFNPFALYAPFDATPLKDDFESVNRKVCAALEAALEEIKEGDCAGFMRGKLLAEYNRILADVQRVGLLLESISTPSKSDFENEHLEK